MGHLRIRKAKVGNTQPERCQPDSPIPASFPQGVSLALFWFQAGKDHLDLPLSALLPILPTRSPLAEGGCCQLKSGVMPRREGEPLCAVLRVVSSQTQFEWHDSTPAKKQRLWLSILQVWDTLFLHIFHSLISWFDLSISTLCLPPLSHSLLPEPSSTLLVTTAWHWHLLWLPLPVTHSLIFLAQHSSSKRDEFHSSYSHWTNNKMLL